jgi:hypothetical protein
VAVRELEIEEITRTYSSTLSTTYRVKLPPTVRHQTLLTISCALLLRLNSARYQS